MSWARRAFQGRRRASGPGRAARPPVPGPHDAAAGYLYVPCVRHHGCPAGTRGWVQAVPIVRKTATLIYYTSDSWDRREAVVSPGCVSRGQVEAGRCRLPGPAGRVFFATREAAEAELRRREGVRAGQVPSPALVRDLRRAMAEAHPDRGGTAGQFIDARRRYEAALRPGRP